jgi:hypothetical protein
MRALVTWLAGCWVGGRAGWCWHQVSLWAPKGYHNNTVHTLGTQCGHASYNAGIGFNC